MNSKVGSYTRVDFTAEVFSQSRPNINDVEFPFIAGLQKSLLKNVGLYGGFRFLGSGFRVSSHFAQSQFAQWVRVRVRGGVRVRS